MGCKTFFNIPNKVQTHPSINKVVGGILSLSVTAGIYWKSTSDRNSKLSSPINPVMPLHYEKVKMLRNKWEHEMRKKEESLTLFSRAKDIWNRRDVYQRLSNEEAVAILFSRAEEIKEIYKDTHYVFIHAQTTAITPITYLINILARKNGVAKSHFFKFIRTPKEHSSERSEQISWAVYGSTKGKDHIDSIQECVLSADICFSNKQEGESAYYFLKNNHSVLTKYKKNKSILNLTRSILKDNNKISDTNKAEAIGKKIQDLSTSLQKSSPCGNLWVFCIPKPLLNDPQAWRNIAYRSHPMGTECYCHDYKGRNHGLKIVQNLKIAQDLQDNIVNESTRCSISSVPQYRLIIPGMTPEKGVLSFMLTPFSKQQRRRIKRDVEQLLK